jgi:hypothetical protein
LKIKIEFLYGIWVVSCLSERGTKTEKDLLTIKTECFPIFLAENFKFAVVVAL